MSTNAQFASPHYKSLSYDEAADVMLQISNILQEYDYGDNLLEVKGERCAIYAKNSPLWLLSDLAIQFAGGVTVPIYDALGLDNIKYCLQLTRCSVVFTSGCYLQNVHEVCKTS